MKFILKSMHIIRIIIKYLETNTFFLILKNIFPIIYLYYIIIDWNKITYDCILLLICLIDILIKNIC